MTTGKALLKRRQKHKHYSKQTIEKICRSDLQQFLYWYDDSLLDFHKKRFFLSTNENIIVYPNIGYDHYTGKCYSPIELLVDELNISYADTLYLLNYFYFKVEKKPLAYQLANWTSLSHIDRRAVGKNDDLDLDTILTEDLFSSEETEQRAYAYKRSIAYLCEKRNIDRDIVLNLVKQGFIKMDKLCNLCFVAYADPLNKQKVIAISKKGTTDKRFCPNYVKEHNEGFFYAKKEYLESRDYQELYIFESPVDLLSFLSLIQSRRLVLSGHDPNCCYIALNGAANRAFVKKIIERYPTIKQVNLCLDNDQKGMDGAKAIAAEIPPRYIVEDLRPVILTRAIGECGTYFKDYNDLLCGGADIRLEV